MLFSYYDLFGYCHLILNASITTFRPNFDESHITEFRLQSKKSMCRSIHDVYTMSTLLPPSNAALILTYHTD